MAHPVMPRKRISTAERLLLGAEVAADLLLACVVNRILMSRKIVRAGEHRAARLAGAGVDPVATVRSGLAAQ